MERRSLLASLALLTAGARTTHEDSNRYQSHTRSSQSYKQSTYPQVLPLDENKVGPQFVDRNTPICYTLAWTTIADETPADLQSFLDATDFEFQIDNHRIRNSHQYWSDIYKKPDDQWGIRWSYLRPGKPLGEFSISVLIEFDQPFQTKTVGDQMKTWSGTNEFEGIYRVI